MVQLCEYEFGPMLEAVPRGIEQPDLIMEVRHEETRPPSAAAFSPTDSLGQLQSCALASQSGYNPQGR